MILQEYDEELHIANEKELSYQEGWEEGWEKGQKDAEAAVLDAEKRAEEARKEAVEQETARKEAEKRAEEAIRNAEEAIQRAENAENLRIKILSMKLRGRSEAEIAQETNLPLEAVQKILLEFS